MKTILSFARVCARCERELPPVKFAGGSKICRSCYYTRYRKRERERKGSEWRGIWRSACANAWTKSNRLGLPFNLTQGYLAALWAEQNGKCALTGVPMVKGGKLNNAYSASMDRVKTQMGYVQGNIRLVCFAVNAFRGEMSDAEMVAMAAAIVKFSEDQ